MRKPFLPLLTLLAAVTLFASCKKDKGPSNGELIVGSWRFIGDGEDRNNNKILDPEEKSSTPAGTVLTYEFKSNGTGQATTKIPNESLIIEAFTWQLTRDEQVLGFAATHKTLSLEVTKLTPQNFEVSGKVNDRNIIIIWSK